MSESRTSLSQIQEFLKLPAAMFVGTTWLAFATICLACDVASLLWCDRSLVSWLRMKPSVSGPELSGQVPLVWLELTAATALCWFILAPTMVFGWRRLLLNIRWAPWRGEHQHHLPRAEYGWRPLDTVEREAIEANNATLLNRCQKRREVGESRSLHLKFALCMLACIIAGWLLETPQSGLSIVSELLAWQGQLSWIQQLMSVIAVVPLMILAFCVLTDQGVEYDDYIQLPPPPRPTPTEPNWPPPYLRKHMLERDEEQREERERQR